MIQTEIHTLFARNETSGPCVWARLVVFTENCPIHFWGDYHGPSAVCAPHRDCDLGHALHAKSQISRIKLTASGLSSREYFFLSI
jgi:hypothetical protein